MTRVEDRDRFLERTGWSGVAAQSLAGDASRRSYLRLDRGTADRAILMDAPPEAGEDVRPFLRIGTHLSGLGLSPPTILARDETQGFLLLEDLGDGLFARLIEGAPERETELYLAAADTLIELHRHPAPPGLPPLGPREMAGAVDVALTWYAAGCGATVEDGAVKRLARLILSGLMDLPQAPSVLALRDFHAENLIWLPDREGAARVGLLDFQDAFAGQPAYDLISLLEDARRDVSEVTRIATIGHYVQATGADPDAFALACAMLGAQRNLRILGVFARLSMHFDKRHYVDLLPRVWGHVQRDLRHPALADLADFVRCNLPEPTPNRLDRIRNWSAPCPTP